MKFLFDLKGVVVTDSGIEEADSRWYVVSELTGYWWFIAHASVDQQTGAYVPVPGPTGQTQGCYSPNLFLSRIMSSAAGLKRLSETPPVEPLLTEPLIGKEYPKLLGDQESHEAWITVDP